MAFQIRLTESITTIKKKIEDALIQEMNPVLERALGSVKRNVVPKLIQIFKSSETYDAILTSDLKYELGLPAGQERSRLDSIVEELSKQVEVEFKQLRRRGSNIYGGYTVYIVESNFRKVLNLPDSQINTEKGQTLNWLKWMLLDGDRIILNNAFIKFGNFKASRSGGAIVVESKRDPVKGWTSMQSMGWSVPKEHSGTQDNNWVTRALFDNIESILDIIGEAVKEAIEESI